MGHAGVGSVSYTFCLLLNHEIGIKPTLVPFTGTAPVLNAMLGDQVDYVCDPILGPLLACARRHAKGDGDRHQQAPSGAAGRADIGGSRAAELPGRAVLRDVCAQGHAAGRSLDKLADALDKGLDEETVRKRLIDLGAEITEKKDRGPKPLAALVKSEMARLTPILKAATAK